MHILYSNDLFLQYMIHSLYLIVMSALYNNQFSHHKRQKWQIAYEKKSEKIPLGIEGYIKLNLHPDRLIVAFS